MKNFMEPEITVSTIVTEEVTLGGIVGVGSGNGVQGISLD